MKKLVILLGIVLVLVAGAFAGMRYMDQTYITLGDERLRRDVEELDLSGQPLPDLEILPQLKQLRLLDLRGTGLMPEQYEQLAAAMPECEILWLVPFQDQWLETDIRELTVDSISEEDMAMLGYFPQLETIDANACTDLDAVMALQAAVPQCRVEYTVPMGIMQLDQDCMMLDLRDADASQLAAAIPYLPKLQSVRCTGRAPDGDAMAALAEAYPQVDFEWSFDFFGNAVTSNTEEVELNGVVLESLEELEQKLGWFNGLKKLVILGSSLPSEELDALWKRHPETRIVWDVTVGRIVLRTDETTFMPYKHGYTGADSSTRLYDRDCAELKYMVDIICMDIGHMWINDISFVAYMPNMEYFLCCGNGIDDISPLAGLQKLKYVELFSNPFTDVSALATCPVLEDINLSYIHIPDVQPLLELKSVKNLWLSASYLTEEQKQQVSDAHPDVNIVFHQMRSTGFGWRELPNYFAQRDLLGMHYMVTEMYKN